MRLLTLIFLISFFEGSAQTSNIYSNQLKAQDGKLFTLSQFKGKKIVLVMLPSSRSSQDSIMLLSLDSFSSRNINQLYVIGIPAANNAYTEDSVSVLNNWYKQILGNKIIISVPANMQKSSGQQDPIFAWLTHASLNDHFDQDVEGPGQVYFINESGNLYGIKSASAPLSVKIMTKMIQKN